MTNGYFCLVARPDQVNWYWARYGEGRISIPLTHSEHHREKSKQTLPPSAAMADQLMTQVDRDGEPVLPPWPGLAWPALAAIIGFVPAPPPPCPARYAPSFPRKKKATSSAAWPATCIAVLPLARPGAQAMQYPAHTCICTLDHIAIQMRWQRTLVTALPCDVRSPFVKKPYLSTSVRSAHARTLSPMWVGSTVPSLHTVQHYAAPDAHVLPQYQLLSAAAI